MGNLKSILDDSFKVIKLGDNVKHSINGRIGTVMEFQPDNVDPGHNRVRVRWLKEASGVTLNIRTWVNKRFLKVLPSL